MKLLMCHCVQCKHGRSKGPHDAAVHQKKKRARGMAKMLLRKGEYDKLPVAVAIGYTD